MRILIIDDDPEDIDYFLDAVRRVLPDCTCESASDCERGLQKIRTTSFMPSFIFLDGMLFGMSSQECLKRIKSDEQLRDVRVIMYSGFALDELKVQFHELGAEQFLLKPTRNENLEQALRSLLLPAS